MGLDVKFRQLYLRVIRPAGTIRLPAGSFVRVRRLGLYELDNVEFHDPGPFMYPYLTPTGARVERPYDLSQWTEPPKAPGIPEELCQPTSMEWALWKMYNLYQSAIYQRVKQVEAAELYAHDVARYILANCLKAADRALVSNPACYEAVYQAAICPEVGLNDIETALSQTFHASFDGQPILDQLFADKGGSGKVDALRQWAGQAREKWQLTKEKWGEFSLKERAEMIVSLKLPDWLSSLEWQKREREK